jgi:hypothetical protein
MPKQSKARKNILFVTLSDEESSNLDSCVNYFRHGSRQAFVRAMIDMQATRIKQAAQQSQ